jgi:nicotinate-nucleotide adenylyltransferase
LVINEDPIEISSSDIRSGSDQTRKKYLPKAVLDYIEANGIYAKNATVTEEDLIRLRGELNKFISGKRLSHSLAVEEEVAELAVLFGLSENNSNRLRAAAILHDITKELSVDGHLELCKKHSLEVTEDDLKSPKVFHSLTGAYEAMELYPETIDRETFNAIKYHTTGRAGMTLFDKLLYLADYIEKTRTFTDCVKLREYFYSKPASVGHLNKTLLISFDMTLKNLEDEGQFVHPSTLIARNAIAKEIT